MSVTQEELYVMALFQPLLLSQLGDILVLHLQEVTVLLLFGMNIPM